MRKPRSLVQGARYHVTARANRRELILNSIGIKKLFMKTIKRAKKKYKFALTTFCIMGNHIHLMIQPLNNESLSIIMQWILATFAINYNNIFNFVGHVWYDRFHSSIIKSFRQYIETFIYIADNPVKAKIVQNAELYQFGGIWYLQKGLYEVLEPPDISLKLIFPRKCLQLSIP